MSYVHYDCNESNCKVHYAYIRYKKKWIKIGDFTSGCKKFDQYDEIKLPDDDKPENSLSTSDKLLLQISKNENDRMRIFLNNNNDHLLKLLNNKNENFARLMKNKETD